MKVLFRHPKFIIPILGLSTLVGLLAFSFYQRDLTEEKILQYFKENPEFLVKSLKDHPLYLIQFIQKLSYDYREEWPKYQEKRLMERVSTYMENPLPLSIDQSRRFYPPGESRGFDLVVFGDFQCPKTKRLLAEIIPTVRNTSEISYVFMHFPQDYRSHSYELSLLFEAVREIDHRNLKAFHDLIFKEQELFAFGVDTFYEKIFNDFSIARSTLDSFINDRDNYKRLSDRIYEDVSHAKKMGIRDTPYFIFNGIPLESYLAPRMIGRLLEKMTDNDVVHTTSY